MSVVVPVLDGGERFRALLARLAAQAGAGAVEVVVVDSGSADGSREAAAGAGARVFSVPRGEFHHARVRNAAIERCSGEFVALLSQDAVPAGDGFLAALAGAVERDPRVAGAYARQVPRPGADPYTRAAIGRWTPDGAGEVRLFPGEEAWARLSPRLRADLCRFDDVASCLRREDWERVPLPDVPFGEDAAWALEALRAGRAIAYAPEAVVEHSHDPSFSSRRARDRAGHRLLAERFGLVAVPAPWAVPVAWVAGMPAAARTAAREPGLGPWGRLALLSRHAAGELGALIGQWEGARDAAREADAARGPGTPSACGGVGS